MVQVLKAHAFSKIAKFYDAVYADKNYRQEVEVLCRTIMRSWKVLDIGSGTGKYAELLTEINENVVWGLEPCKEMAEISKTRGVNVINGFIQDVDPQKILRETGPFNCVIATFDVLDYVISEPQYNKALRNINRLLPVGGLFFYEGWNKATMPYIFEPEKHKSFMYEGEMWHRESITTYHVGRFCIRYTYTNSDRDEKEFVEEHYLRPQLIERPNLKKFGFVPIEVVADKYSVKAWFVKVADV